MPKLTSRLRQIACLEFLTIVLFACSSPPEKKINRDLLPGKYIFSSWNQDTLDLAANKTYSFYTVREGKRLTNSGAWSIDTTSSEIILHDFTFFGDASRVDWRSKIKMDSGFVHLIYATEENVYFNKLK